jgi:hypothetical protein
MGVKNETILNLLVKCPWWASVVASGAAYVALKFILPSIDFGRTMANSFAKGISGWAPFVSTVLLIPAPLAALNSFLKERRRDRQ